jgi:hypothetical protein
MKAAAYNHQLATVDYLIKAGADIDLGEIKLRYGIVD